MWIFVAILGFLGLFVSMIMSGLLSLSSAFFAFMIIYSLYTNSKIKKDKRDEEERVVNVKEQYNADDYIQLKHMAGLPFPENMLCDIFSEQDNYIFVSSGNQINLGKAMITDVSTRTDTEIQQFLSSSAGGAMAGALMFGAVGAMVGGRANQKSVATNNHYLTFTYLKDDEIKYLAFDCTEKLNAANEFVNKHKQATVGKVNNIMNL